MTGSWLRSGLWQWPILIALMALAFGMRAYHVYFPPLAWDEGWSVAISQLPLSDLAYLTAADVHPPGYYLLLRPWLNLGRTEFILRFLSLIAGVLAVPLAYQAGRVWLGRNHRAAQAVGLLSAAYVTVAPLLIYYSQVGRMYAVCAAGTLLATWGLLRSLDPRSPAPWSAVTGWTIGALLAVYSFYYSALALAGLGLYAALHIGLLWRSTAGRQGLIRLAGGSLLIAILYAPWLLYAVGPVQERVTSRTETGVSVGSALGLLDVAFQALIFEDGLGWVAVGLILVTFGAGVGLEMRNWRREIRDGPQAETRKPQSLIPNLQSPVSFLLPVLAIGLTLLGVALGTQAHMFAARYTIAAAPFLGLGLAYSLVALWTHAPRLAGVAAALLTLATLWPTWNGTVYAKGLERFAAFEPWADARALRAAGARPGDVALFNLLSLAGAYDVYRQPGDPPWTYAQRWDPVAESMDRIKMRLVDVAKDHNRVWTLLYKGTVGPNRELRDALDKRFYIAGNTWRGDTLTSLYLVKAEPLREAKPDARWNSGLALEKSIYTAAAQPGGNITVDLKWRTERKLDLNYTVFVHLYDPAGRLVAQHDSQPDNGAKPTSGWTVGRSEVDLHGLVLPFRVSGPLSLQVGWYEAISGERLRLDDGRDMIELGMVEVLD